MVNLLLALGRGALGAACAAVLIAGCASQPAPFVVRYADIRGGLRDYKGKAPLVVEFQAGDRLPVNLQFSGEAFELESKARDLTLVAKKHCFVRFGEGGVRVSLDATSFDAKPRVPGSFFVGFHVVDAEPTRLDVRIVAPTR